MSAEIKLLKLPEVLALTKKSRTSTLQAVKNGAFPAPVNIGEHSVAWVESEVQAWIQQRAQARFPTDVQEVAYA